MNRVPARGFPKDYAFKLTYIVDLCIPLAYHKLCILEHRQLLLVKTGVEPPLGVF